MYCSSEESFQCKYDECIQWKYVCDGVAQCTNKADEYYCGMCTNDVYICKDLSRINCTLACSSLGYIPCQNYVDKLVCSSIIKKTFIKSNFNQNNKNANSLSGNNSNSFLLNQKIVILISGILLFVIIAFILFIIFYKRKKEINKKRRHQFQTHNHHNPVNNENILHYNEEEFFGSPNEFHSSAQKQIKNDHKPNEYEGSLISYGEPPPEYHMAKYFPEAVNTKQQTESQLVHIYESIDDVPNESIQLETSNACKAKNKSRHFKTHKRDKTSRHKKYKNEHSL